MNQLSALAIALVALLPSCGKKPGSPAAPAGMNPMDRVQPVETLPVETRDLTDTIDLTGTIAANESADIRAEIPGTITAIHFEEGSQVKKGDPLVALDTRELDAQLNEAKSNFTLAEKTLTRAKSLVADDAISKLELDSATADFEKLRASVSLLEVRLAKSTVTAPFDGAVGARALSIGDYVTPQDIITRVDDLSRLKVEVQVPERYLPMLQPGSTFQLSVASVTGDQAVTGRVYFVSPNIDISTRSSLVKGYVENPPSTMRPGMFANIRLVLRTIKDALVVPEAAVMTTAQGTVVIAPQEKDGALVAAFVPVKIGLRVPGYVQVTPVGPPLKPGDKVVSSGVGGLILIPGMKLQPVEPVIQPAPPTETDRKLEKAQ